MVQNYFYQICMLFFTLMTIMILKLTTFQIKNFNISTGQNFKIFCKKILFRYCQVAIQYEYLFSVCNHVKELQPASYIPVLFFLTVTQHTHLQNAALNRALTKTKSVCTGLRHCREEEKGSIGLQCQMYKILSFYNMFRILCFLLIV